MDLFMPITKLFTCFNFVVSAPIYLSVLAFLLSQKRGSPFTSSFYTLFIALGFVDLSKFVLYILKKCSYWGFVPAAFYPLNQANCAANFFYFLMWALALMQFQLNFLLSFNRFCAICCAQLYRCQWTPKITQYLLIVVVAFGLAISAPILWQSVCFRSAVIRRTQQPNGGDHGDHVNDTFVVTTMTTKLTGPVFMNISTQIVYYNITKAFAICHLAFLLIAYPMMCRKIRHLNMKQRTQLAEVRMFYSIILLSVANLLFAVYLIIWDLLSMRHAEWAPIAEWSLYMIIDFYDMNSPYGLLLTSKLVRKCTLPCCCSISSSNSCRKFAAQHRQWHHSTRRRNAFRQIINSRGLSEIRGSENGSNHRKRIS